jgi:predicted phosphodiesterase
MIGIFSDIHGHSGALKKAISTLKGEGASQFYCLGDVVGYIPSTLPVSILQEMDNLKLCLQGNHEDMILSGFNDKKKMDVYKTKEIRNMLTEEEIQFLKGCKTHDIKEFDCGKAIFVHGSPANHLNGYIYPDTDLQEWSDIEENFVFIGHTHRPFVKKSGNTTFVNVGSCGLPRDKGDWGSAALFDDKTGDIRILRFSIKEETNNMLKMIDNIHPSVLNLFNRNDTNCFGEFIDV